MNGSIYLVLGCAIGLLAACGASSHPETDGSAGSSSGGSISGGRDSVSGSGTAGDPLDSLWDDDDDDGGDDDNGGDDDGGDGVGGGAGSGSGGPVPVVLADGSQHVEEGAPGTVGAVCTSSSTCQKGLVCSPSSLHCQPFLSQLPPEIVQVVPLPDTANIPSQSPIVLFADGTYDGVEFTVASHTVSGIEDITARMSVVTLTSASGKDVYVLAAKRGLPLGASIVVTIGGDLEGTVVFSVDHAAPPFAEDALDFEGATMPIAVCPPKVPVSHLPLGWSAFGDVGTVGKTGTLLPTSGSRMIALSTGTALCSNALGSTSSMLVSGPIRGLGESPALQLDYNFQSSEFDEYCSSEYDDTLIGVLSGPGGVVATVIDSVNLICDRKNHKLGLFPEMPDNGEDDVYKETGDLSFELAGDVGSPAVLAFVLTDVGDATVSSLVGIDNIRPAQY
jgi:hypothetical protein